MSCYYKDECPSYSGWCEGPKQDFSKCVQFLISAFEAERSKRKVLYATDALVINACALTVLVLTRKIFGTRKILNALEGSSLKYTPGQNKCKLI